MTTTLLTGLPRSGTTLVCACLNQLPDCIALAEPVAASANGSVDDTLDAIDAFVQVTRTRALSEGHAASKTTGNILAPENFFDEPAQGKGLRKQLSTVQDVPIGKPLSPDFALFIKHPALFTAMACRLRERYPLYAVVRHPLFVLASWQTVDAPVNRGRVPAGESVAPDLKRTLNAIGSARDRQLALLQWFFEIYKAFPLGFVIRYEDLVSSPTDTLAHLHPFRAPIPLEIRTNRPETRYSGVDLGCLARDLLSLAPVFEVFYPDFADSVKPYLTARN